MKFLLRIIIVIALVAGVIFGVNYCNNKKTPAEMGYSLVTENYKLLNGSMVSEEVNKILPYYLKADGNYNNVPNNFTVVGTSIQSSTYNQKYNKMQSYLFELKFASNPSNEDIEILKNSVKSLQAVYDEICEWVLKFKEIKINSSGSTKFLDSKNNSVDSIIGKYFTKINQLCAQFNTVQTTCLQTFGNYILVNVYNEKVEEVNNTSLKGVMDSMGE